MRELFGWSACIPCITVEVCNRLDRGELEVGMHGIVHQALGTLSAYCTEMEYVSIDSDQMAGWLQRHADYEELLFDSFEEACETCTHQHEPLGHSWITDHETGQDYPLMPKGIPHPRWREVLERGDRLGVCCSCIEDQDNIDAFVDLRYVRDQPQIPKIIHDLVETCGEAFKLQGRIPVEISPEMYISWVENQTLTAPWYAFSVTARYIWRFLRNCDHMYIDFTPDTD